MVALQNLVSGHRRSSAPRQTCGLFPTRVDLPGRAVMLGASDPTSLLLAWMGPLLAEFTAPTARHALVLLTGAVLAPARRTVAAALRAAGYGQAGDYQEFRARLGG